MVHSAEARSSSSWPRMRHCCRTSSSDSPSASEWGSGDLLGSWAGNGSGDLFLAFSTANRSNADTHKVEQALSLSNDLLNPFFQSTIDATEEAVVNAMLAATTMEGADGLRMQGLPGDKVVAALKKYGRMP